MPQLSERARGHVQEGVTFVKWLLYSCLIGVVVGLVAVAFHLGIDLAAELRGEHPNIIWLLPLGGMAIVLLYRVCGMEKDRGTNLVLVAVRDAERLKLRTAPLIFLSTILTHLVGGSALQKRMDSRAHSTPRAAVWRMGVSSSSRASWTG